MKRFFFGAVFLLGVQNLLALDNGLALTPPMGWISWERFRCNIDCDKNPDECISERLYKRQADELVAQGYRDLGYVHVNIDDCWSMMERDENNRLVADPKRFPSGMKALAKYMHDRGLKLGIYGDAGTKTCAGYPGSKDYVDVDAQTYADWDIDMLKLDGCNVPDEGKAGETYMAMTEALNKTGRPILYSCEWPLYQLNADLPIDYKQVAATCNIFRNYNDVENTVASLQSIMDFYVTNQDIFTPHQGPGAFFDPDMLIIGDSALGVSQSRIQMALWTIWGSPLFMSNDLFNVKPELKAILQNKAVIALNQDPEGLMGKQVAKIDNVQILRRPVLPKIKDSYSFGLAFIYTLEDSKPKFIEVKASVLGLTDNRGYELEDLFDGGSLNVGPNDVIRVSVEPTGAKLFKATLVGA